MRTAVSAKGMISELEQDRLEKLDANFGMRKQPEFCESDEEQEIDDDANIMGKREYKTLPPCVIRSNNPIAYALDFFACLTIWTTLIVTPCSLIFGDLRRYTRPLNLGMDIFWCLLIISNFLRHDEVSDHSTIAQRYVFSRHGSFWFDVLSTIPPLIFREKKDKLDWCHMLRLYHLRSALAPIEWIMTKIFSSAKPY